MLQRLRERTSAESASRSDAVGEPSAAIGPKSGMPARALATAFDAVVFDKDGTLIDFQLMWGTWIESLAWKLEMESQKPVRDLIFERLGYDWLKRSVVSGGPRSAGRRCRR